MLFSSTIYDTHAKTGQNQLKLIGRAQYQLLEHNISCSSTISIFSGSHVTCPRPIREQEFVCLFVLMLYVPVNSYGHVGTSPPISWDFPYLKSPHHTCGTPHNICGTPQVHVEFLRNPCGILQCFAELRKGFTTCGICSTSHIGIFSASIWKICGKFRLSFFT